MQPLPHVYTSLLKPRSTDVEVQVVKLSEGDNCEKKRILEPKNKDCFGNICSLNLSEIQPKTVSFFQNQRTIDVESQDADALSKGETSEEEDEKQLFKQKTRKDFRAKWYGILTLQLLPTFAIILALNYSFQAFMCDHFWIVWIFNGAQISLYCAIACSEDVQRNYPLNFVLLNFHTLFFGLMSAWICAHYGLTVIWLAVLATASITFAVTIYTKYSPWDVTGCQRYLFVGILAATVFTTIVLVGKIFIYISLLDAIIAAIVVFLLSFYLINVHDSMDIVTLKRFDV